MTEKTKISNYEKMKNQMAEEFLKYDQEKMIQKFSLEHDEHNLFFHFLDRKYRIDRQNGQISWSADSFQTETKADYNEAMTIYDVLCYSKEYCHPAHELANVGSLSRVQGGNLAKGSNFFQNAGEFFDGKTDDVKFQKATWDTNLICFLFSSSPFDSGNPTMNSPPACKSW